MSIKIKLNRAEMVLATEIALGRYNNARQRGIADLKMGDQSNFFTDIEGIGAEIAVAKHFNVFPDTELDLPEGGLPTYDLMINGKRIDVKSTIYSTGNLLVTLKKKEEDCDMYFLVIGQFPEYELKGWTYSKEVFQDKFIEDKGHGPGYCYPQVLLKRFKEPDDGIQK